MTQLPEGFGLFEVTHQAEAAPAEVYDAFINPEKLAAWFGPVGWSVPLDSITVEPREGGVYAFTMVNEEDETQTSPADAIIDEIHPGSYIRSTERANAALGFPEDIIMEVFFEDVDGGTRLTVKQSPLPEVVFEPATEGWKSSFTKLDALLGK